MKICCVLASLAAGGAERVMSLLVNQWARRGWYPTIVTLSSTTDDAYELDPEVKRVPLNLAFESTSNVQAVLRNSRRIVGLRRAIDEMGPAVVVSFGDEVNVVTLLAGTGLGIPVIISLRTVPTHFRIGRAWSLLRRVMYPRADALVVQTDAGRLWAERFVASSRIRVIPNPVGQQFVAPSGDASERRRPVVLGVGRLGSEKGFDLLIQAFQAVWPRHREWSLVIAGSGPLETELKRLASTLLDPGVVSFVGRVGDPERYYREAGVFVLPSRYEGFPNALLEAMASGCPVIAANCPVGPAAIIQQGVDGILVPSEDVPALAAELERLMSSRVQRDRLGERAARAAQRFRLDHVAPLWDDLLSRVAARRRPVVRESGL